MTASSRDIGERTFNFLYWLRMVRESGFIPARRIEGLVKEAHELG